MNRASHASRPWLTNEVVFSSRFRKNCLQIQLHRTAKHAISGGKRNVLKNAWSLVATASSTRWLRIKAHFWLQNRPGMACGTGQKLNASINRLRNGLGNDFWLQLSPIWAPFGSTCGSCGPHLAPPVPQRAPLGLGWAPCGRRWSPFGPRVDPIGLYLDPAGLHLDPICAPLGSFWGR